MRLKLMCVIGTFVLSGCVSSHVSKMPEFKMKLADKVEKANAAYEEARLDIAESLFLQITTQNPTYVEAWLKLGNIYVRQARLKAAIRCFEEAIKRDQEDGRAWYNLALVRVRQATKTLETAEQLVPLDSVYQTAFMRLHKKLLSKKPKE